MALHKPSAGAAQPQEPALRSEGHQSCAGGSLDAQQANCNDSYPIWGSLVRAEAFGVALVGEVCAGLCDAWCVLDQLPSALLTHTLLSLNLMLCCSQLWLCLHCFHLPLSTARPAPALQPQPEGHHQPQTSTSWLQHVPQLGFCI